MSLLYVYGFVDRRPVATGLVGLHGEPIELVEAAGLLVAAGRIPEVPAVDESSLRAHDRAIRALAEHVDAILPARFGSAVADEEHLAADLALRAPALEQALRLVAGCVQMTLRVFDADHAAPEEPAPPPSPSPHPGREYLESRRGRDDARLGGLAERLGPIVRADRRTPGRPPLVASLYHLIGRGDVDRYRTLVAGWAEVAPRLRIVESGPWPPYCFAPEPS